MAVSDLRIALGTFTRRKTKKNALNLGCNECGVVLPSRALRSDPFCEARCGLPPPHRTPYPPTPTPSRVALRARGFKGGGEVFSRVSQCPISRAKKVYGLVLPHFINKAPSHVLRGLCWNFFMILSKFIIKVAAYWYN